MGAVASLQQVDTVLALMSTDPIYHRPDHLAVALHLVVVVVAAAVDTAADPTIHTLLALDPDHQDPDDGVEEEGEVMELVGVMIMMPDAAVAAAVSTTIVAQVETIGKRKEGKGP